MHNFFFATQDPIKCRIFSIDWHVTQADFRHLAVPSQRLTMSIKNEEKATEKINLKRFVI